MKRLIVIFLLIVIVYKGKTQNTLTHKSIFMYRFNNLNIILVNQFMTNTSKKTSPAYIRIPEKENVFNVYGPYFEIIFTSVKEPFTGPRTIGGITLDTSEIDNKKMKLEDLQIKVTFNKNEHFIDWQDITKFYLSKKEISIPFSTGKISLADGRYYSPMQNIMLANDSIRITIRNKKTKKDLLHFRFMGIGNPVAPFLSMWTQDSSSTKSISLFMQNEMSKSSISLSSINTFYEYWPTDYSGKLKNEKFYETTKLALYFRKPGAEYPDSSMEYRLLSESNKDTTWHKTGHILFITQLESGSSYKLQIRYILHPSNIQEHTFYVVAKWYQTNRAKFIAGILSLILILFAILLTNRVRLKEEKRKNNQLDQGLRTLRSQLNPHFLFNALSSIQGLINKNDIPGANHYLTEFSNLLRETLKNNDKELVPLQTELDILKTYLKLEQLRFQFKYEIIIDEKIDKNSVEIPALLLQPLIENAIKHGISTMRDNGLIKIDFYSDHQTLRITIWDNGIGFIENTTGTGLGLKLTKDRIALLNQSLKKQPIQFSIESLKNTGTTVHLSFKNWL